MFGATGLGYAIANTDKKGGVDSERNIRYEHNFPPLLELRHTCLEPICDDMYNDRVVMLE
jgi:hypothetical protein